MLAQLRFIFTCFILCMNSEYCHHMATFLYFAGIYHHLNKYNGYLDDFLISSSFPFHIWGANVRSLRNVITCDLQMNTSIVHNSGALLPGMEDIQLADLTLPMPSRSCKNHLFLCLWNLV